MKKVLCFIMCFIISTLCIGCKKQELDYLSNLTNEENVYINNKNIDDFFSVINIQNARPEIITVYNNIKYIYEISNDKKSEYYIVKNEINNTSGENSVLIPWVNALLEGNGLYENLNEFSNICSSNLNKYTDDELIYIFISIHLYNEIDFNDYENTLMEGTKTIHLDPDRGYLDILNINKEQLERIKSENLFSINPNRALKIIKREINEYIELYQSISILNYTNYTMKLKLDNLMKDILNPNSNNYLDAAYLRDATYNLLKEYKLSIDHEPGILKAINYISDIESKIGRFKDGIDILNGDFKINISYWDGISGISSMTSSLINTLDSIQNKGIALNFALSYMYGDSITKTGAVDYRDILNADIKDKELEAFTEQLFSSESTINFENINGNANGVPDYVIEEFFELSALLKSKYIID